MSIYISWTNDNKQSDQITRIYRAVDNISKHNLPAQPIAVLENKETSFIDEDVLAGVLYAYIVEIESGDKKTHSLPIRRTMGFDSRWGDGDDTIVSGNPNTFALGKSVTSGDFPDGILREVMRMLGAPEDYNSFRKIVNAGRYFIVPENYISVKLSSVLNNNCLLGHRSINFNAGNDASKYGNNEPFIYKGRKWRVGMPQISADPVASVSSVSFKITEAAYDAERGYCTADTLITNEFKNFIINWFQSDVSQNSGRTIAPVRTITSFSTDILLSSIFSGTAETPNIVRCTNYSISSNSVSFNGVSYPTSSSTSVSAFPHIEYLGVA